MKKKLLERKGVVEIAVGIQFLILLLLSHNVFAKESVEIYTPKLIPAKVAKKHALMVATVQNIAINYTYGKIDLEGRIKEMKIYACGNKTIFLDFYRYGENIESGNCTELYVADSKVLYAAFVEQKLDKKYLIEVVRGTEPRFFNSKLKKVKGVNDLSSSLGSVKHYFIRIVSKETGDQFYRDPSFNMTIEFAGNSEYCVVEKIADIPGGKEMFKTYQETDGPDSFVTLGQNSRNEMVYFSGWNGKGYWMAIKGQEEIEYFLLSPDTIHKISDSILENICNELLEYSPRYVDCDNIPKTTVEVDFNPE